MCALKELRRRGEGFLCDGKLKLRDTALVHSESGCFHPLMQHPLCEERRATERGAQNISPGRGLYKVLSRSDECP